MAMLKVDPAYDTDSRDYSPDRNSLRSDDKQEREASSNRWRLPQRFLGKDREVFSEPRVWRFSRC
jgi:hypothetical protein